MKNRAESAQFYSIFSFHQAVVLPSGTHSDVGSGSTPSWPSCMWTRVAKASVFLGCLPYGLEWVWLGNRHFVTSSGGKSFFTFEEQMRTWGGVTGGTGSTTVESAPGFELLYHFNISLPQFTHSYGNG